MKTTLKATPKKTEHHWLVRHYYVATYSALLLSWVMSPVVGGAVLLYFVLPTHAIAMCLQW